MVDHVDSDGADQIRACTRKKGYPSEEVARFAISTIRRTSPYADLRSYGCRHCGLWHVGGVPMADRRSGRFDDEVDAEPRVDLFRRGRGGRDRRKTRKTGYTRGSRRREEDDE